MSLPVIHGEFGVVQDPDMRFGDDGKPWMKIRGVAKDRKMNPTSKEWEDGDPCYLDIVVGGKLAENLAESVIKGDAIIVSGKLHQREWVGDDGKTQKAYSLRADSVGVSTRFSAAPTVKFKADAPAPVAQSEVSPF